MILVIDTNQWCFNLTEIKALYEQDVGVNVTIVVPFTVLQRLDKVRKRKDSLGLKAAEASKFIYLNRFDADGRPSRRFIFESMRNAQERSRELGLFASDDRILGTALHYQEKGKMVILCSEDINLQLKCHACQIHSSTVPAILRRHG